MLHNIAITLGVAAFIYIAHLAGVFLLGKFKVPKESQLQFFTYSILAGLVVFGFVGTILSGLGIFNPIALWIFTGMILVISRKSILEHIRALPTPRIPFKEFFKENGFLKAVMLLWLVLNFLIVFVPITGHDTLDYHLPIIKDIIATGKLTFSNDIPAYPYLPVFGEILYATPMVLFGNSAEPFTFQLLQFLALPLMLLISFNLLKGAVKNKLFIFAALFGILSLMDFEREIMHGGYVDVFAFLFGFGALFLVLNMLSRGSIQKPELWLSALLLGGSIATKYTGLFFGLIIALFLFVHFIRKKEIIGFFRSALPYLAIVLVVGGYWYAKNAVAFGNPVYPMFSDPQASGEIEYFLMDRAFLNFFAFPFARYGQWFVQERETSSRLVVLVYFIISYLLLAWFAIRRKAMGTLALTLFAFAEMYLAILFVSSHQYRFLIPTTIALPLLIALLLDRVNWKPWAMKSLAVLVSLGAVLLFLANLHYFEVKFKYLVGTYTKEEYILEIGGQ